MNLFLTPLLISVVNLYFLKDSPNLLVRFSPLQGAGQPLVYYSFSDTKWDSSTTQATANLYEAVLTTPESLNIVAIYIKYPDGRVDNNNGLLYYYELKKSPRMLLPFSIDDLEKMLRQARKKINQGKHIDEALSLLDYVSRMLKILPYIKDSELEIKKQIIEGEVKELYNLLAK